MSDVLWLGSCLKGNNEKSQSFTTLPLLLVINSRHSQTWLSMTSTSCKKRHVLTFQFMYPQMIALIYCVNSRWPGSLLRLSIILGNIIDGYSMAGWLPCNWVPPMSNSPGEGMVGMNHSLFALFPQFSSWPSSMSASWKPMHGAVVNVIFSGLPTSSSSSGMAACRTF